MSQLNQLTPQPLWQLFSQICAIPHPSKHEQQLSEWVQAWAKDLGLYVDEDEVGNLLIRKPATKGMENRKGVVLQAHLDMVPQKNNDKDHDFTKDPIEAYVDGEWVTANGTTLGADNGIGMASALAVLASDDVAHGPLEVLLTIDEEAGMTGAFGLKPGWFEGELLINTDSEQEGEVYMGCAGGIDGSAKFSLELIDVPQGFQSLFLTVSGLKGGHSGVDIHTGRANANKLLIRFLFEANSQFTFHLTELNGGSLRNAIPRDASACVVIAAAEVEKFKQAFSEYLAQVRANLHAIESDIAMECIPAETFDMCWAKESQTRVLSGLQACPNGVIRMSDDIEGVVETSLNLGVIRTKGNKFEALTLIRSLHDDGRKETESSVLAAFSLAGAQVTFSGAYPGWKPDPDSKLMQTVRDTYQSLFGKIPDIMVIHAGLECGLFKTAYPTWDMVSFGPTIKFPHSPDEKVEIATVDMYWQLLVGVLAAIPQK